MRKKKAFIVLFAIISLSLVIHSFRKELQKEIEFGKELFGIPTYANSRFCKMRFQIE
ncbi:MAG: hypothetical protein GY765_19585 [bacterium]|nr:hypothetical protein [bacterium]